eukprot:GHVH01001174.1.p4 GENE.GHVH01001174.1~~GHVH01001174.1.p4  ORF type:complete len:107 (-),score=7.97 GHVH01001174.1:286-606(-)
MRRLIKSIWFSIKWVIVSKNRNLLVRYTRRALDLMDKAASLTENKNDDRALKKIRKEMENIIDLLPGIVAESTAEVINETTKGPLKTVNIGFDKNKGIHAGFDIKF